jgi:hypothetical protein
VFSSNIAIVIGPTPPGTGVTYDETSSASESFTSPFSPEGVLFIPTSIIIASFFIKSLVINSSFPILISLTLELY